MSKPPLSPAAQAVLATFGAEIGGIDAIMGSERRGLAAALRAAADQVVPADPDMPDRWEEKDEIRHQLFAIAAELEASNAE